MLPWATALGKEDDQAVELGTDLTDYCRRIVAGVLHIMIYKIRLKNMNMLQRRTLVQRRNLFK